MNKFIKEFNEIQYLKIRDIKYNEKKYTIYFDIDTQSKVIICDDKNEVVEDQQIIKKVMETTFKTASDIMYDEEEIPLTEIEDETTTLEYPEDEKKEIFYIMKKIFFEKFGTGLISEKELDERIEKNIKRIFISDDLDKLYGGATGEYDIKRKEITVLTLFKASIDRIPTKLLFHEFIHGIIGDSKSIKSITIVPMSKKNKETDYEFSRAEEYEYGRSIDEGIVSYIENMTKVDEWQKIKEDGGYDEYRRIVTQLVALYNNVPKDNKYNFIEQYIVDPENTLVRLNKIFEDYVRDKMPEENDRNIKLLSMRQSLNFVISADQLRESPEKLKECEDILAKIFEHQILRKPVETKEDLYDILYEVQGYIQNLSEPNEKIQGLINEKVNQLLENDKNISLEEIIEELPDKVSDSPTGKAHNAEERLLMVIFGEDERYRLISNNLEKLKLKEKEEKEEEKEEENEERY